MYKNKPTNAFNSSLQPNLGLRRCLTSSDGFFQAHILYIRRHIPAICKCEYFRGIPQLSCYPGDAYLVKNANLTTWYYGNLQQVLTSKLWFHMRQMKPFLSWLVIFAVFVLLMPLISEDGEDDSDRTECNITGKGVNEIS